MNTTHPLKMTPDRYDHPVHGPLNVCILLCAPRPTITWVRGPPARLVRCGAGITPTTNEGHSPPLEWESVHPNDATPAQSPMGYGRFVNRPF